VRPLDGIFDVVMMGTATDLALGVAELDSLLATLPPGRRGLPLAITVGRLHRVKGMATLVEAWASDATCAERCNLLVVGGDLNHPTDDEDEQLARIDAAISRRDAAARGLLLAGHRPNGMVATWLAAVRLGRPGLSAPGARRHGRLRLPPACLRCLVRDRDLGP